MTPAPPARERLTAADLRFLAVCFLLLAATVWFSARYFHRAFPEASIDFRVTRTDARTLARQFLAAAHQYPVGYREASRFSYDEEAKTFLERELGLERANALMGTRVRLWRWSWRWFRPQQKEEFRVDVTPRGEIAGFAHLLPEAAARPSLDPAQARAAAEAFLRERMGRDPAGLDFVEVSTLGRPARTDYGFTWKERDFNIHDATYRVEVTVQGNAVGGYREYLKVPEAWLRDYERLRSRNMMAQSIDTALMLVLAVGLLVTIVVRVRGRDVRWRRAAVVGLIGGGLYFLSSLNSHPLNEFNYPTTDSYANFLARLFLNYLMGALASAGFLFVLTAGAEPLYRQYFGSRVSLGNLFRPGGLRAKSFFKGAVLGLTLTGIFVAYQTAFYLIAYRFGAWSPADVPYDDLLNTRFPWLFVLFGGFLPAVSEEFLFRMFAIPWLRGLVRSTAAAIVLAGFIWGFGHAGYPQQPFWIRGVEVGVGGVALGLIMLRWGILPTLVWHYSVDALYTALLLLRSHNLYFVLSGAASAGIMVLPAAIAFLVYLRRGGFEPEAELTNAREGSAAPVAEKEAPTGGAAAVYQGWTTRRRALAVGLGAAGFALLAIPVERFGAAPRFAVTADQARAAASAFLAQHGLAPGNFRSSAFPISRWEDEGGYWNARVTASYILERRPVAWLQDAYTRLVPLRIWSVRYYRPLEREEMRVSVHAETGQVTGFLDSIPEDRPGPDIASGAARSIAEGFLASRGVNLAALELKESSSERQKARRDHTLVWEARPGDPRNVDEARYRVRVEVTGDRVSAMASYWKLPEAFVRAREEHNALSTFLIVVRLAAIAGAVVLGLWLLIQYTRRRVLRWRTALLAALPAAVLGALGSLSNYPLMMRAYSTAMPLETFRAMMFTGILMSDAGLFLAMACAAGLVLGLRPGALRAGGGWGAAGDVLCAAALASGLAAGLSQLGWLARGAFHAQALYAPDALAAVGAAVPAGSLLGGAAAGTMFALAALALVAYAARWAVRSGGRLALVAPLAVAAMVSTQAHTRGEFLLEFALAGAAAAAVLAFAWFARGHNLAWFAAVWTLAAGDRALALLAQPAPALRLQGALLVAAWAAVLAAALAIPRARGDSHAEVVQAG